jgi:hypothetical protein
MLTRRYMVAGLLAGTTLAGCASFGAGGLDLVAAIKRLLGIASKNAMARLASPGGFLDNAATRIGLGDILGGRAGSALLVLNQLGVLSAVEGRLNRAAESAAGKVAPWIAEGVQGLAIQDAAAIINGPGDGATQLLKAAVMNRLRQEVSGALGGAFQALDVLGPLAGAAGINIGALGLGGLNVASLTQGATDRISDAVFGSIAREEQAIRANPAATGDPLIIAAFAPRG